MYNKLLKLNSTWIGRRISWLLVNRLRPTDISIHEFESQWRQYNSINTHNSLIIHKDLLWPLLNDRHEEAGSIASKDYFLQDILVASLIYADNPDIHYDIGSRLDGFIAHLLSFRQDKKTVMIDIRPMNFMVPGLSFIEGDATNLETIPDNSIESISTLHAVEHFGLGRYGDVIDPDACFKTMNALQRVLKVGGVLYFSVPCGRKEKVCFNAHRIFNPYTITDSFKELTLLDFYYIDIEREKIVHVSPNEYKLGKVCEMLPDDIYGEAGIFVFRK